MKKFLLLLIVPFMSFGQTDTLSFEQKLMELNIVHKDISSKIQNIELKLDRHHKQHAFGVRIVTLGTAMTILGLLDQSPNNLQGTSTIVTIGSGLNLIGGFIMLNSHKWFSIYKKTI